MPVCIVPGCPTEARNTLSVRIRWPDTHAAWVRETGAHVCDAHATSGARLTILFEPSDTQQIELRAHGCAPGSSRITPVPEREVEDADEPGPEDHLTM